MLHSDRPTPGDDVDGVVRREGVGILMTKRATAAWTPLSKQPSSKHAVYRVR